MPHDWFMYHLSQLIKIVRTSPLKLELTLFWLLTPTPASNTVLEITQLSYMPAIGIAKIIFFTRKTSTFSTLISWLFGRNSRVRDNAWKEGVGNAGRGVHPCCSKFNRNFVNYIVTVCIDLMEAWVKWHDAMQSNKNIVKGRTWHMVHLISSLNTRLEEGVLQ